MNLYQNSITKSHPYLRRKTRSVIRTNSISTSQKFTSINMALRYVCENHNRFSVYADVKIQEIDDYENLIGIKIDIGERLTRFGSLNGIYRIDGIRDLIIKDERYDYMIKFTGPTSVIEKHIKSELKSLGIKIKDTKIDLEYYYVLVFMKEDDFIKFRLGQSITSNLDFISLKEIWYKK